MTGYGTAARIKSLAGILYTDLGLANDAAWDVIIAQVNDGVSRIVDGYCGRDFATHTDDVVKVLGGLSKLLRLPHHPIISIKSIYQGTSLIPGADYHLRPVPGTTRYSGVIEYYEKLWMMNLWYTVTFTWGFAATPVDVVQVVEDMTLDVLRNMRDRYISSNASSVNMGGFSFSIEDHLNHDATQLARLNHYRQIIVG